MTIEILAHACRKDKILCTRGLPDHSCLRAAMEAPASPCFKMTEWSILEECHPATSLRHGSAILIQFLPYGMLLFFQKRKVGLEELTQKVNKGSKTLQRFQSFKPWKTKFERKVSNLISIHTCLYLSPKRLKSGCWGGLGLAWEGPQTEEPRLEAVPATICCPCDFWEVSKERWTLVSAFGKADKPTNPRYRPIGG